MSAPPSVHIASAVVPVVGPPMVEGAVAVAGGSIVDVGPAQTIVEHYPDAEVLSWQGVLLPGLVNAHTHLQYSSFASVGSTGYPSYISWSERFVSEYEARRHDDWQESARSGLEAGLASGTTAFADIVTDVPALGVLMAADVAGVAYLELIGVDHEAWRSRVRERTIEVIRSAPVTADTSVGLSPHAPYSVDLPVLIEATALARQLGVRIHSHLAESDTEDDYYRRGRGALAERVTLRVGRPWSILAHGGVGVGAAEFARSCGLLGSDSHVAHGVYLGSEGRKILRSESTYVALCPRSNLTVGIDPPPVADFLREGNLIAVGTDSLGSSSSLDLLEDLALLHQLAREGGYRDADLASRLLEAATMGGAGALGLQSRIGSLERGKRADLAIFDLDPDLDGIEDRIVISGPGRCQATVVAGETRHRAG
ncbi:MAG TPA: amidohydrolase family protein [Acidimicrobiia bacterium]|nr:amidohydrolase family protein [Acidimicrobiia bacterium]